MLSDSHAVKLTTVQFETPEQTCKLGNDRGRLRCQIPASIPPPILKMCKYTFLGPHLTPPAHKTPQICVNKKKKKLQKGAIRRNPLQTS